MTAAEAIIATVENTGQGLRRSVQAAVSTIIEHGLAADILRLLEPRSGQGPRWLHASLVEATEGLQSAAPLWERVVTPEGCEIPESLLHRARASFHRSDVAGAASHLRLAMQCNPDYDFFLRAESLVRKCRSGFSCHRTIRIALLSSSTTAFLRSVITMLCLRDGLDPEFYEPPFGAYMQDLLQSDSKLGKFQPEFAVLVLNWRDLGLEDISDAGKRADAVARVEEIWKAVAGRTKAQILQLNFVPPQDDSWLALSSLMDSGRARAVARINETLLDRAPGLVTLIDTERIAASSSSAWEDPISWSSAKLYPAPQQLPAVAENIVSCIRAELGLSRKLLVLDLDNTLWGGIIGEDGMDAIQLGPPSATGERYQDFHRYLKSLSQRGILLAVISKNNPDEAAEVFDRHAGCVLKRSDFVAFRANWESKPANIRALAADLRLGLDSFVFLDDNPAERSAVRRDLPEVVVPEISGEPSKSIEALNRGLYFQSTRLTSEDLSRAASYMATAGQEALRENSGSLEQYLTDLRMQIQHGPVDADTSVRVTQLVNKTNQFNLTTRRYSQDEVRLRMSSRDFFFRWYRLRDRFAEHGLIGVLLAEKGIVEWTVDTWLMSCRVIGRGVEEFMLRDLAGSAREDGAERLRARYIPTPKNGLVEDLLPRLGFTPASADGEFILDLTNADLPECPFLSALT